jgi:hypothetical protein
MPELIIDLNKLDLRELLEAQHQWARDVVQRSVRLAIPGEGYIYPAVTELYFFIACKTIPDQGKTPVPLDITRSLEELVEDGMDDLF